MWPFVVEIFFFSYFGCKLNQRICFHWQCQQHQSAYFRAGMQKHCIITDNQAVTMPLASCPSSCLILTLLSHLALTYTLEPPFSLQFSFASTVTIFFPPLHTNRHLSPRVKKTSSPLHYHPKRLLRLLSSSEVTYPKPTVMNLNTASPLKPVSQCIL